MKETVEWRKSKTRLGFDIDMHGDDGRNITSYSVPPPQRIKRLIMAFLSLGNMVRSVRRPTVTILPLTWLMSTQGEKPDILTLILHVLSCAFSL